MSRRGKWTWFVGILFFCMLVFGGFWGYEYHKYATPEKALATYNSHVGPFETISFAKGVILITPGQVSSGTFTAWYMKKGLWGWKLAQTSNAEINLTPQNYNVDFESFAIDGQTFVWGTTMTPIKEIIYNHAGKTYTCQVGKSPVWHMILPFTQSTFLHSEWTMVLPNGTTAALFK